MIIYMIISGTTAQAPDLLLHVIASAQPPLLNGNILYTLYQSIG